MDFAIGAVGRKQVRPVAHFSQEDSDDEEDERSKQGKKPQQSTETTVRVDDLVYCATCHSAFADRGHYQRHLTAYHSR